MILSPEEIQIVSGIVLAAMLVIRFTLVKEDDNV